VLHTAHCKYSIQDAKIRHLRTIAQLCRAISSQINHVSTIGKKLLKHQCLLRMSSQCVNFGPAAEIGWRMASLGHGHPSKFQRVSPLGFVTAPTSLNGDQLNFARCLAVSWLVQCIYIFGGSCPKRNSGRCKIHFASKSCVLLCLQRYCTALEQCASAKLQHGIFARQGSHPVRHWAVELSSYI